mmetsp:Transcript_6014/g.16175  ORF Transcript_6014/g.16175 Transcript_6014/m.16175 type:complete len:349 (-) Transcript_6014:108-1154(-)
MRGHGPVSPVAFVLFISFESCVALLAQSDRPVHGRHPGHPVPEPSGQHHASPVSKKKAEEMRLNDRHYAKLCVNPAQHHSSSDNVTRFDGPPRVLWQTEKQIEKELPDVVNSMRKKWVDLNKDIEMKYMDDGEALAFVEANFDKSVLDAFKGFPLGVMRADFWRYLVVYTYGGVYADVDVEPSEAIRGWLDEEENWQHCSMVVGQENGVDISQWTFAATPKHPALKAVIDLIVKRYQGGIKTNFTHFVHYHTGPAVFTSGIHMYASRTSTSCETGPGQSWVTSGTQICILPQAKFFNVVTNHYGSKNENFTNVLGSWTAERDQIVVDSKKRVAEHYPSDVPCRCAATP